MKQEFTIDTEIYPEKKIKEAIEDFSDIASISINGNILEISGDDEGSIDEVFNEFFNYVLSL